jgi:hypothetical protein
MKTTLFILLLVSSLAISANEQAESQCNADNLANACIPKLASGFNFLKSYKVNGESKEKVEYSYVFTKGTQYMINVCSNGSATDGIVVSIFDKERNRVATSKINGQFITAIAYPVQRNGYLLYTIYF